LNTEIDQLGVGVITSVAIDAIVFYKHEPEEVRALSEATIPLAEHIRVVATRPDRAKCKAILAGEYFRREDAKLLRSVCTRAAKHARQHLDEYFSLMQPQLMIEIERLEQASEAYWERFQKLANETVPTH
jgi:hypothetical protein